MSADAYDPRLLAARYARAGLRVFPVRSTDKRPPLGYLWKSRATTDVAQAVQDADDAAARFGDGNVSIAWALGLDGCVALDLDVAEPPEWWTELAATAVVNPTRRGHHLVHKFPEGLTPTNGTARFPTQGWGEARGVGGYIVIAGPDRAGLDVADLDRLAPFPRPEWLTGGADTERPATPAEVVTFTARHDFTGDTSALAGIRRFLERWTPGGARVARLGPDGDLHAKTYKLSRHETAVDVACWIAREAERGELSAGDGFTALAEWWAEVVKDDPHRRGREVTPPTPAWEGSPELASIVAWAVGQVTTRPCAESAQSAGQKACADSDEAKPHPLDHAHAVARKWLGDEYDLDALDVTLAAAAVNRLDGDPLWLLLVSGSGNAKTETVQALAGAGATITSTITSPGALLSASPKKDKTPDSTGGLLRKLGRTGVLVVKDVTSILSMDRNARAEMLAALREVYDGYWQRNVGTDGGRTLTWEGRLVVIGAVTTAWDAAHTVIASMGDRFVLLRMDSHDGRLAAGRRSIANTGHETVMRAELAAAAGAVVAAANTEADGPDDDDAERLLTAADLVTLARTAVEHDFRGDVIDAHAPEMPTRFAKQLAQVMRGARAIGLGHDNALRLALRCARDSMPPLRLAILGDLDRYPNSTTTEVRRRLDKPRATVDRQLQALHALGVIECREDTGFTGQGSSWRYRLADGMKPEVLNPPTVTRNVGEYEENSPLSPPSLLFSQTTHTNFSGNGRNVDAE